jgi:hypothetical protein
VKEGFEGKARLCCMEDGVCGFWFEKKLMCKLKQPTPNGTTASKYDLLTARFSFPCPF